MSRGSQKTIRKVAGRIARHKNVRYHSDAYLFANQNTKTCTVCGKIFTDTSKTQSANTFCSKACRKIGIPDDI